MFQALRPLPRIRRFPGQGVEIGHGPAAALARRLAVELGRLRLVLLHSDAALVAESQVAHGLPISLAGCLLIPQGSRLLVLLHSHPVFIIPAQLPLRVGMAQPGRRLHELKSRRLVLLHAIPLLVAGSQDHLGPGIPVLRRVGEQLDGPPLIPGDADPLLVADPQIAESRHIPGLCRLLIEPDRLLGIRLRADPGFHAPAQVADPPDIPHGRRSSVAGQNPLLVVSPARPESPQLGPVAPAHLLLPDLLHRGAALRAGGRQPVPLPQISAGRIGTFINHRDPSLSVRFSCIHRSLYLQMPGCARAAKGTARNL